MNEAERLKKPIPLPGMGGNENVTRSLSFKVKRAQALRSIAEVARQTCWDAVIQSGARHIESLLDKLEAEVVPVAQSQLIGEIKAWREFIAGPDEAKRRVDKLDKEIGVLQGQLSKKKS